MTARWSCTSSSLIAARLAGGSLASSSWRTADLRPAYEKSHEERSAMSRVLESGAGRLYTEASPVRARRSSGGPAKSGWDGWVGLRV
jgi:hypothetical protein